MWLVVMWIYLLVLCYFSVSFYSQRKRVEISIKLCPLSFFIYYCK